MNQLAPHLEFFDNLELNDDKEVDNPENLKEDKLV